MGEVHLTGYVPGSVGKITDCHAVYYHRFWGFDVSFETQVGSELSEFVRDFQPERDALWVAWIGETFAGSIAVDGRAFEPGAARLRWFIVEPSFQGAGIGRDLLERAVDSARRRPFERLYLWTFLGLERAAALYRAVGFQLTEEHDVRQWGRQIREQRFDLPFARSWHGAT